MLNDGSKITGMDLIKAGIPKGRHIGEMLPVANDMLKAGHDLEFIIDKMEGMLPPPPLKLRAPGDQKFEMYLDPFTSNADERDNADKVVETMSKLMQTPVISAGAVMPDACPAGPAGIIPVGGVAVSEGIHPGMHSADICCSMYLTAFKPGTDPKEIMNRMAERTHFGPGGRDIHMMSGTLEQRIRANPITAPFVDIANLHMGTQGDGNHFAYVGHIGSTGDPCMVTHHGSRGFGAKVFKAGMVIAEKFRREISPETLKGNAWIPPNTRECDQYWEALQIVRDWTKENHETLHQALELQPIGRFWNEHNFVFRKSDGLFYHAKGATPTGFKWAEDATPFSIIPLNMAEPLLIVEKHKSAPLGAEGFAPHGAGRNYSRTEHKRRGTADMEAETKGLDVRFWCGKPDPSELPSAYKNARMVTDEIRNHRLADIVDLVHPFGSIMAGDWEHDAPWKKKRRAARKADRKAERAEAHETLMNPQKG